MDERRLPHMPVLRYWWCWMEMCQRCSSGQRERERERERGSLVHPASRVLSSNGVSFGPAVYVKVTFGLICYKRTCQWVRRQSDERVLRTAQLYCTVIEHGRRQKDLDVEALRMSRRQGLGDASEGKGYCALHTLHTLQTANCTLVHCAAIEPK